MVQTTSHIFSGKVDIESNLLVGSSHLFVDTTNNRVGITTVDPDASLHVNGNAYVESNVGVGSNIKLDGDTGIITATGFVGDASQLTGLASNLEQVVNNGNVTSNTIQFINTGTSLTASGNVVIDGNVSSTTALISNVATIGTTKTFVVTVGGNGKYHIDGVDRPSLELHEHQTYIFDFSSSTLSGNGGHPFIFSETANGGAYTSGITTTGTYGSDQIRTFVVPTGAPTTLYYYCTYHNGMGATVSISPTAELIVSGRVVASGNVEASTFIGDGSQLTGVVTSISLQDATDAGNTTSNTTQFTNTGTSLTASGSIVVSGGVNAAYLTGDGSNVNIGQMAAETVPYVDSNKQLRDSHITRTANKTIITSNLEVIGNVITQNNITVGAQGSYYGDGTTLTGVALSTDLSDNVIRIGNLETDLSDNVIRIGNLETATIISNSSTITTGFTKGDIIYASDDNVLNKLAVGGTDGHVLKVTNAANKTLGWGVETNQWNTVNTNEIHYSGGNVGINVSDPAFKLDVHGTANVGALTATSLSVGGQALALEADLTANASRIDAIYSGSVGDIIYVDATNSLAKRSIGAQGDVLKVSAGGIPVWDGEPDVSSQWSNVTVDEVYFDGNVGISNTNPGHDLSVGSNLFVDDDGSNVLVISGNAAMTALTLGEVSIVASHGLGDILNESNTSPNTMELTNATTGLVATGNVHALKFIGDGSELTNIASNLDQIVNNGNVTSNTIELTNATTGLVATGNVHALKFIGSGSELTNLASNLEEIVNNGNVASNTIELTNATTSLVASGNVEVGGELTMSGTGALTVPAGATGDRPATAANGMIRYNITTGFMEAYSGGVWAPIAQPPTVTGISPLTTLVSGGYVEGFHNQTDIIHPNLPVLTSGDNNGDLFGKSISVTSDGTRAIVGVPYDNIGSYSSYTESGSAQVFKRTGTTWAWEAEFVNAHVNQTSGNMAAGSAATSDYFGTSVAISDDGIYAVVGAVRDSAPGSISVAGSVHIYKRSGTTWTHQQSFFSNSPAANNRFGISVSINSDGTRALIGSEQEIWTNTSPGSAEVWVRNVEAWSYEANLTQATSGVDDHFGHSVSLSSDGVYAIVGAFKVNSGGNSENGEVVIFVRDTSTNSWARQVTFSSLRHAARFGWAVDINTDGTRVVVGAVNDYAQNAYIGAADVWVRNTGETTWALEARLAFPDTATTSDAFGHSVSISSDGTRLVIGAPYHDYNSLGNSGSAHTFIRNTTTNAWTLKTSLYSETPIADNKFGDSVALSGDGDYLLIGEPRKTITDLQNGSTNGSLAGSVEVYTFKTQLFDASTQVFTTTGTGIVSGSTVQLEGADGTLYSVVDATPPNADGTQVTFKMGSEGVEFPPSAMTTNTSIAGYVATASYNSSSAWKAFNDVVTTSNYWNANNGTYSTTAPYLPKDDFGLTTQDINGSLHVGHWIQLQIPNPVILTRAVIGSTSQGYQHGQFVILGSNNPITSIRSGVNEDEIHGSGWTLLHAGLGIVDGSTGAVPTNVTTLSAGSTEAFKYFRVVIKSKTVNGNAHLEINNIQFFGGSGSWDLTQQPYKVRINSTSGLIGTSTAKIGFPPTWTTAAGANLSFDIAQSTTHTLVGTDGGGGTNRTFSNVQALPSGLTLIGSSITGQIAANQDGITTPVTFRLTDNASGLFTDREIDIVGMSELYSFSSFTFTPAGVAGPNGPDLSQLRAAYSPAWTDYSSNLNVVTQGFQEWTVPKNGLYAFEMVGASGGGSQSSLHGGYAAYINFSYTLTKGDIIVFVVGQMGRNAGTNEGSSGGGGTFVWKKDSPGTSAASGGATLIAAAGGGGGLGGGNSYTPTATNHNPDAVATASDGSENTLPTDGSGNTTAANGGQGGKRTGWAANWGGGAGAGWSGNGQIPSSGSQAGDNSVPSGYHATGIAYTRSGGFIGGSPNTIGAGPNYKYGGFGGGGGGSASSGAGGGGGGYSGGYGGGTSPSQIPGSGGSSYCIVAPTATGLQGPSSKYDGQVRVIPPS